MPTSRTAYKYHFKLGNKIVHTGITSDIDRRQAEHRREPGNERGHIFQVGRRTTRDAARRWEQEQLFARARKAVREIREHAAETGAAALTPADIAQEITASRQARRQRARRG